MFMEKQRKVHIGYSRFTKNLLKYKSAVFRRIARPSEGSAQPALATPKRGSDFRSQYQLERPHQEHSPSALSPVSRLREKSSLFSKAELFKDSELSDYYCGRDSTDDDCMRLINGRTPQLGPHIAAAVDRSADLSDQKHSFDSESSDEWESSLTPSLLPRDSPANSYNLFPEVTQFSPQKKKHRLASDGRSIRRVLPSIKVSNSIVDVRVSPSQKPHRRTTPKSVPKRVVQESSELRLEESIHELDELLAKLRQRQELRSSSVTKDIKAKRRPSHLAWMRYQSTSSNVKMGCYCSGPEKANAETIIEFPASLVSVLKQQVRENPVLLYSSLETTDSQTLKDLLRTHAIPFEYFEVEHMSKWCKDEPTKVKGALRALSKRQHLPVLFINGKCAGGLSDFRELIENGKLFQLLRSAKVAFVGATATRT